jgi:hypothetical protein
VAEIMPDPFVYGTNIVFDDETPVAGSKLNNVLFSAK